MVHRYVQQTGDLVLYLPLACPPSGLHVRIAPLPVIPAPADEAEKQPFARTRGTWCQG